MWRATCPGSSVTDQSAYWWERNKRDIGGAVVAAAMHLYQRDQTRQLETYANLQRFHGRPLRSRYLTATLSQDRDIRVNITKAAVETITAQVGKNRPRPTILTDGADHSLIVRAKKLQRFLDGVYAQAEVYQIAQTVFRDAMLCGDGFLYFYADYGRKRLCCERVFPLELLVDPVESINGSPRCMYRLRYIDRDTLTEMFPSKRDAIARLDSVSYDKEAPYDDLPVDPESTWMPRTVRVVEAWRLAGRTADGKLVPGVHVIGGGRETLAVEDYNEEFFPIERFSWCRPSRGYWSDSAAQEIRGLERSVNKRLQRIERAMDLMSNPWVLLPAGCRVKKSKLTNEIGVIVEYEGPTPPEVRTHQPVDPQATADAWMMYSRAFELLGTNQLQSSATKPAGIESGKALELLGETHQVRFSTQQNEWEDLLGRRTARQFLRCARELDEHLKAQGEEGYVLRAVADKTAIKIAWDEAYISPDDFFVECFPTSVLSHLPSGRTEEVANWQSMGWVSPDQAKQLLDFPDLQTVANVSEADQDLLDKQLDDMLLDGKEVLPDPRQNLQNAQKWGTYRLLRAEADGSAPMAHLDRVRDFLAAVDDLVAQQTPPVPAGMPPGAPGAPPGAVPGAPPAGMGAPAPQMPPGPLPGR